MNIGIIFDSNSKAGGGFYQSLSSAIMLNKISKENLNIFFVVFSDEVEKILQSKGLKTLNFRKNFLFSIYKSIIKFDIISKIIKKINYKNIFLKFLLKNKINFVIFLGPSTLVNFIENINYSYTIYDIQHKSFPFFPEYRSKNYYLDRDAIIQEAVNKSFKILVDTERTKKEVSFYYRCKLEKIVVQPFNPFLPKIFNDKKNYSLNDEIKKKIDLKNDQKYLFYPAQFWAHKNHKYIIDFLILQKKLRKETYKIVCCGSNKGNKDYIRKIVEKNSLEENFIFLNFLSDDEVIQLYKNCFGLIMPTFVARSTLPLYESFFFRKPVFYSKDILDEEIYKYVIGFDLKDPNDLINKLKHIEEKKIDIGNLTNLAFEYYKNKCNEDLFLDNYRKIINEFEYLSNRWEN